LTDEAAALCSLKAPSGESAFHLDRGHETMAEQKSSGVKSAFQVDEKLEKGFQEALQYELKDADIERARLLLGVYTASGARELHSEATPDALRNWAHGTGDDNPLYCDEDYGPTTRWGGQIGHGTQVGHIKTPMYGDPMPEDVKQATKGLFRGVHVFVSGGTWDWYRPLRTGDRIYSYHGEESLEVKKSEFADKSVIRVSRNVNLNQHGDVVGVYRVLRWRRSARSPGRRASTPTSSLPATPTRTTSASTRSTSRKPPAGPRSATGRTSKWATSSSPWSRARSPSPRSSPFTPAAMASCPTG
jgi:acyl dehydratase